MQEKAFPQSFTIKVESKDKGKRLDAFIQSQFPDKSRNKASDMIRNGDIRVGNTSRKKPAYRLTTGDIVSGQLESPPALKFIPQALNIQILFEDNLFLVINKDPGIVVHPAPGHENGTLCNGILYHRPQIEGVGVDPMRPGIVHRLDKDTSGAIIVAKTPSAYSYMVSQFKSRQIRKSYLGIVYGIPEQESGQINLKIARHHRHRKKMAISDSLTARFAETHWTVIEKYFQVCLLKFDIKTGRTHQIRVHSASMRHPIIGDTTYGYKRPEKRFNKMPDLKKIIREVPRQLLHAWQIGFTHPETDKRIHIEAPIPADMANFIHSIKKITPP